MLLVRVQTPDPRTLPPRASPRTFSLCLRAWGVPLPPIAVQAGRFSLQVLWQTDLVERSRVPIPVGSRPTHGPVLRFGPRKERSERSPWSYSRLAAGGVAGRRAPTLAPKAVTTLCRWLFVSEQVRPADTAIKAAVATVAGVGLEPTRRCRRPLLRRLCLPFSPPREGTGRRSLWGGLSAGMRLSPLSKRDTPLRAQTRYTGAVSRCQICLTSRRSASAAASTSRARASAMASPRATAMRTASAAMWEARR